MHNTILCMMRCSVFLKGGALHYEKCVLLLLYIFLYNKCIERMNKIENFLENPDYIDHESDQDYDDEDDDSKLTDSRDPHEFISDKIRSQVSEGLWLQDLNNRHAHDIEMSESGINGSPAKSIVGLRCVVCTLPVGSCKHTSTWIKQNYSSALKDFASSQLENELDNVLGILGKHEDIITAPQIGEVDLNTIKWTEHMFRLNDKIGDEHVPIALPTERGWHSLEKVGKYLVLFGGVRCRDGSAPKPFSTSFRPSSDVVYLNDVFLFDTVNVSWHILQLPIGAPAPCGRYGMVSHDI